MSRKMERESPKVIDVYTQAILMRVLHSNIKFWKLEMAKKLSIFSPKIAKNGHYDDRLPLRRDTIASRNRFRPMGARQNLALYYKKT